MMYVNELPEIIQEILLLVHKRHLLENGFTIEDVEDGKEILLNSKVSDLDEFLVVISSLDF